MNITNIYNSIFEMSAMADALIIEAHAKAQKPSVVGRIIIPQDNSYATSLETGCDVRVYGKKFVCISEPYVKEIEPLFNGFPTHKVEMVKVRSVETDREYEVMFAEEYLAKTQKSSVVGKTIIPMDNSYAKSLETDCNARVYGQKFVCISEPYANILHKVEMVKVRSVETNREYEVMFAEEFLVSE